jgi:hypothetical protein
MRIVLAVLALASAIAALAIFAAGMRQLHR